MQTKTAKKLMDRLTAAALIMFLGVFAGSFLRAGGYQVIGERVGTACALIAGLLLALRLIVYLFYVRPDRRYR